MVLMPKMSQQMARVMALRSLSSGICANALYSLSVSCFTVVWSSLIYILLTKVINYLLVCYLVINVFIMFLPILFVVVAFLRYFCPINVCIN